MEEYYKKIYAGSKENFYKIVDKHIKESKKMFIITANPEMFSYCAKDKSIEKILLDKEVTVVADGIGLVKTAKYFNQKIKERISGIDISEHLLKLCNANHNKIALLGGKQEVIEKLEKQIKGKYPNIRLDKIENGYTDKKDEFFKSIKNSSVDVILVALGMPEQEKIIYRHYQDFKKGIFIGVGGTFDVLSGYKKRAPKIIQKMNLEWLYRIVKEPKRIKRFYKNNILFLLKVRKESKGKK